MKIFYRSRFEREFKKLTKKIQNLAEEKEEIFRKNPFDLRLDTHKLHGPLRTFWAFSVDYKNRIIFEFCDKNSVRFYSIGDHNIYW